MSNTPNQKLRRKNRALEKRVEKLQADLGCKENIIQIHEHTIEKTQAEHARTEAIVRRIVDVIRNRQPMSSILPEEYKYHPSHSDTRASIRPPITPLELSASNVWDQPNSPELLYDLMMELEDKPTEWERLIFVRLNNREGAGNRNVYYKISKTMLEQLMNSRAHFCEHIGREIAGFLYAHMKKEGTP